jgi:hypothetical protein
MRPELRRLVLAAIGAAFLVGSAGLGATVPAPALRIIKDALQQHGNFYVVVGTIYNPSTRAVKNVVVRYYIWKKWQGTDGHGSIIKEGGGLVEASIRFIPPKASVDFVAESELAPVMTAASGLLPDPIIAEISAEWDQ